MKPLAIVALLLAALPARAQSEPPPEDEPPSQAAREAPPCCAAAPTSTVVASALPRNRVIGELGVMPAYMSLLGSDWLGTQLSVGVGGEATRSGFQAVARFGAFLGASTFGVGFEHLTIGAAFVIPTGTRFHLTVGNQFGVVVVNEPHTIDGSAWGMTIGGYVEPTIDLVRVRGHRLAIVGRLAYDFVETTGGGSPNAVTTSLGLVYSF